MRNILVRGFCYCAYYGLARYLPGNHWIGGKLWGGIRAVLCRPLFRECGVGLYIERMVQFGLGDKVSIGNHSGFGENTRIIGDVRIGDYVGTSFNVFITASNREFSDTTRPMAPQGALPDTPVVIEDDVIMFANVVILPGVRLGKGSAIGAAAVVSKNVPRWSLVVGNPARVVKFRRAPEEDAYLPNMTPIDCELPKRPTPMVEP